MPIYKTNLRNKEGLTKYKVKINVAVDGENKQIMRTAYGLQSAKDLEGRLVADFTNRSTVERIKYKDLLDNYCLSKKGQLKESTLHKTLRTNQNHLLSTFSEMWITEITPLHCEKWKIEVAGCEKAEALGYKAVVVIDIQNDITKDYKKTPPCPLHKNQLQYKEGYDTLTGLEKANMGIGPKQKEVKA